MTRALTVYLYEKKAGTLTQGDDGRLAFRYDRDYLSANGQAISVAMPLTEALFSDKVARAFFSGILPDEGARQRLAAILGVSRDNAFGLLEIIGGECAGALTLLPPDTELPTTDKDNAAPLTSKQLADILHQLRDRPLLGGEQGVRLSLAGAQDKLAVCVSNGEISLPTDGRPTTHILKPFIQGLAGTVENELFCMRLAQRMGLSAPDVATGHASDINYLLIERYDRYRDSEGLISKRHQEDFCQALSVPPEMKYETEGGPGVTELQAVIAQHTQRPAADRLTLLNMLLFHYLVGNADAHAKNYALLYRETVPELAPVYDVVCTAAYPGLSKRMAMQIGGRDLPDTVQWSHWLTLVPQTRGAQRLLQKEASNMAEQIGAEADTLLEELREAGTDHPILKAVRKVVATRAKLLLRACESR